MHLLIELVVLGYSKFNSQIGWMAIIGCPFLFYWKAASMYIWRPFTGGGGYEKNTNIVWLYDDGRC